MPLLVQINPLSDLFGKTDLSEVITQLSLIVTKLGEISTTVSEFKTVFANGFNVNASVEEINKLTNRVKELEGELLKVKSLSPTSIDGNKSNISSENVKLDETISSTSKIEDNMSNVKTLTDNFGKALDPVLSKFLELNTLTDKNGNIYRLFHNSPEIFDKFDTSKSGSNQGMALGAGNYLALSQSGEYNSEAYGKYQTQWYALVKKAFDINAGNAITQAEADAIAKKFFGGIEEGFGAYISRELAGKDASKQVEILKDAAEKAKTTIGDIFNSIGYDAIKDGAEINVFNPDNIVRASEAVLDISQQPFQNIIELSTKLHTCNQEIQDKELKKIDSSLTSLYEDYTDAISALGEDEWFKQQEITNEFERQQEALLDQYEIAKQQLEVSRQRTKMENIANEKNKRMLIGGKWVQTPDLKALYEAKKELTTLEDEEYELRREAAENKEINALRNLNDITDTEAKAIQNRIDMINKMTSQERKALAEELLKVKDMDKVIDSLGKRTLPNFVQVIKDVIDNLGGLADVDYSSDEQSITIKGDYGSSGNSSYRPNITPDGSQDGYLDEDGGFKLEVSLPKHHTGRIRGLTPDEERVILTKDESVLTPAQLSPIAQKLMNATDLVEQLRENAGLLSPTLPSFNIPNVVKNDNSSSNQNIYIDNIVVKEPVQDMNGLLHSVMQEAKLYHLRTKNIR